MRNFGAPTTTVGSLSATSYPAASSTATATSGSTLRSPSSTRGRGRRASPASTTFSCSSCSAASFGVGGGAPCRFCRCVAATDRAIPPTSTSGDDDRPRFFVWLDRQREVLDVGERATHEERVAVLTTVEATGRRVIGFFTRGCLVAIDHEVSTRLVLWADYAPEALVQWVRDRRIDGVSLEGFIFFHELIDPLHEAGVTISVGAVNSSAQLERLLEMHPDIIVSDCPTEIRNSLTRVES